MKRLKVYIHLDEKDRIDCLCLREHKGCKIWCEKGQVFYDQYQGLKECFKNKDVKMTL